MKNISYLLYYVIQSVKISCVRDCPAIKFFFVNIIEITLNKLNISLSALFGIISKVFSKTV